MSKQRAKAGPKKQLERIKLYQNVFTSREGHLVLLDLMAAHHIMAPTFKQDVNELIFKEGERNVVLRILSILGMDVAQIKERIEEYDREMAE